MADLKRWAKEMKVAITLLVVLVTLGCGRTKMNFPADTNGDVFRRMQAAGDDLTKARDIDFVHIFASKEDAEHFSTAVQSIGYQKTELTFNDEKKAWDVSVVVIMVPTHSEVTRTEEKLGELAKRHSGRSDGWGCFAVK